MRMTRQVALLDDVAAWLCAMVITAYVESGSEQALLLTYGVNDCEARLGVLPLRRVWAMLTDFFR